MHRLFLFSAAWKHDLSKDYRLFLSSVSILVPYQPLFDFSPLWSFNFSIVCAFNFSPLCAFNCVLSLVSILVAYQAPILRTLLSTISLPSVTLSFLNFYSQLFPISQTFLSSHPILWLFPTVSFKFLFSTLSYHSNFSFLISCCPTVTDQLEA